MGKIQLTIKRWAAWMPEAQDRQAWVAWSQRPDRSGDRQDSGLTKENAQESVVSAKPSVDQIPPMLRRRLSPLGKMAASVAWPLLSDGQLIPSIFCSRHGELSRTVDMLRDLAKGEDLSPTHFSLSVHNAIGGVFSIARKDTAPISALACGDDGICQALLEAALILQESEYDEALCVFYDAPIPGVYRDTLTGPAFSYAAAFVIGLGDPVDSSDQQVALEMQMQKLALGAAPKPMSEPHVLSFIRFLLANNKEAVTIVAARHAWMLVKRSIGK
ncbi:beta-ketoacyl synthase chain length factor [Aurantivibrio infirmus]